MNDCGAPLSIHHYLSGFDCKRPCGSDTISIPQFSPYSGQSHGRAGAQAHLSLYSPVLFVFYLKYAVSTSFSSHFTLLGICCVWKLKHYALVWWLFFFRISSFASNQWSAVQYSYLEFVYQSEKKNEISIFRPIWWRVFKCGAILDLSRFSASSHFLKILHNFDCTHHWIVRNIVIELYIWKLKRETK